MEQKLLDVRRRELKYRISLESSLRLQHKLAQIIPTDRHNGPEGYLVRSLYFDSLWNTDFEDKENGLEARKKIRLRVYSPEDATAKLELKEKDGVWQRKQSLTVRREEAIRLSQGDYSLLGQMDAELAQSLYLLMTRELYRPVCMVQYRRFALTVPTNDIRITFDRSLTSSEGDLSLFGDGNTLYPVGWPDDVTLEVKYNHFLLSYIKDVLEGADKAPVSYSKYVMSRHLSHWTV